MLINNTSQTPAAGFGEGGNIKNDEPTTFEIVEKTNKNDSSPSNLRWDGGILRNVVVVINETRAEKLEFARGQIRKSPTVRSPVFSLVERRLDPYSCVVLEVRPSPKLSQRHRFLPSSSSVEVGIYISKYLLEVLGCRLRPFCQFPCFSLYPSKSLRYARHLTHVASKIPKVGCQRSSPILAKN
eukprot:scaffold9103_cov124-Skeletonema_dohrnii-CCMP3373.AAC.2